MTLARPQIPPTARGHGENYHQERAHQHPTRYTLHATRCIPHPTPHTLHPTPYTLHAARHTPHATRLLPDPSPRMPSTLPAASRRDLRGLKLARRRHGEDHHHERVHPTRYTLHPTRYNPHPNHCTIPNTLPPLMPGGTLKGLGYAPYTYQQKAPREGGYLRGLELARRRHREHHHHECVHPTPYFL